MTGTWRRFAVLFGGSILLFASMLGIVATVEHDQHCQLAEVRESPQGGTVEYYYSELSREEQQLFERMRANPERGFDSDACIGGTVRHEGRYYVIEERNTVVWTNPPMLVALGGFGVGIGVVGIVARREMKSRPW